MLNVAKDMIMIRVKRLMIIIVLMMSNTFLAVQEDKRKKETILGKAMTNHPIWLMSGAYLMAKDIVHQQLGAHIPYVFLKQENYKGDGTPLIQIFSKAEHYKKSAIIGYGRYGYIGALLFGAAMGSGMATS